MFYVIQKYKFVNLPALLDFLIQLVQDPILQLAEKTEIEYFTITYELQHISKLYKHTQ